MRIKIAQGFDLSPYTGRNYAPAIMEAMKEATGHKSTALAAAMERLLSAGRITADKTGPRSKQKTVLVLK
jgi:hypothetical protein